MPAMLMWYQIRVCVPAMLMRLLGQGVCACYANAVSDQGVCACYANEVIRSEVCLLC